MGKKDWKGMRAEQKKKAEDFLGLLEAAHDEICKAVEKNDISAALTLLEDCQNGALALGNMIEEIEGEEFVTVSILEEYCDQVYQIYESIAESGTAGINKIHKTLRKYWVQILNSVKHDIRETKEAVFLPYKASMWDSLESVWQAADDDPDCEAFVIPIPYYDRKPDGSFGELHYELEDYPEDVPVIKYEEYDFETRKPDMIFIHNPYDDCNYVTSVHPFFYSTNLKRFTTQLIYIPYFVLGEIDPDNPDQVKSMEHFCTLPGVINADRVIVQSENVRKAYIKVLTDTMKGQGMGKKYWEEKILGIGSPKMDKVLSTRKEELQIPPEWLKIIEKPDGNWKKVILYNTSVGALLYHHEKMLVKIRDVLHVFRDVQDEVALLWRPHPLMKATIESMRPMLWEEYQSIVEEYRKEGYGIYDDSPDIDRAVALCDAYYGDPSSVVEMCRKVEKPIMIQNVEVEAQS